VRVSPADWRPIGVAGLEPAAWAALRADSSTYVVAGPGAGKTEFLAQRAAYLLQTGLCPQPFQILAISFKRDAASNLAARVASRCSPEQAGRFQSMTFDAFTKGLLDRFIETIPKPWRPTRRYEIVFLDVASRTAPPSWQSDIIALPPKTFESEHVGTWRLPEEATDATSATEFALQAWWARHLADSQASRLTFNMINRLAELVLRTAPTIARALRVTYPIVFLDEFQDATFAQYDFLLSAFQGSRSVVTAVGDEKQRIMVWAGARSDAFSRLAADFMAARVDLRMNYRSSPELVRIQHVVARALDSGVAKMVSQQVSTISDQAAQIWRFDSQVTEAAHLASWVSQDLQDRSLSPRDYVLLVRQKAEDYEAQLKGAFRDAGLNIRNEAKRVGKTTLQDLLTEEFACVTSALLRLGVQARAPAAWQLVTEALYRLRDVSRDDPRGARQVTDELSRFLASCRLSEQQNAPNQTSAADIAGMAVEFLNLNAFRRVYRSYSTDDSLQIAHDAFLEHLANCAEDANTWSECIDAFDGVGQVPLMTVHKSKGLEYDTTLFVGLDDEAWWSHTPGGGDGLSTFFVALSRAKQRAIFTYCDGRGRRKVRDLYQLLADAGVQEYRY
jgi:superfamily I DNA/RNA helicase